MEEERTDDDEDEESNEQAVRRRVEYNTHLLEQAEPNECSTS